MRHMTLEYYDLKTVTTDIVEDIRVLISFFRKFIIKYRNELTNENTDVMTKNAR